MLQRAKRVWYSSTRCSNSVRAGASVDQDGASIRVDEHVVAVVNVLRMPEIASVECSSRVPRVPRATPDERLDENRRHAARQRDHVGRQNALRRDDGAFGKARLVQVIAFQMARTRRPRSATSSARC